MSRALSPKALTRRDALRLASAPLLALGMSRFAQAEEAAPAFSFIAVNDLHSSTAECAPFFRNVVARMKARRMPRSVSWRATSLTAAPRPNTRR